MTERARRDAVAKVTGRARFTADLRLPGMLVGKLVRSSLPHARIVGINVERARAVAGVRAILLPEAVAGLGTYGHVVADRPVLAQGVVRYAGEPVAAVAAVDADAAAEAAEAVEVTYDPLPAVLDPRAALAPDAVCLHPDHPGGNLCFRAERRRGDVEAAMARAYRVYEGEWEFPSVYHYAMEPHTVLAAWYGDRLAVWSSAQHPFIVRRELAALFRLPLARVRVAAPYLGGGFGSKSYTKYEPVVAALARQAGRPVLLEFSVEEAMLTNRRHNARIWVRTGVDAEGRLVARQARMWLDTGAYADNGPRVAGSAADQLVGPYHIPAFAVEALTVYTNKSPAGSYRAIGKPQALWATENQLDIIAADLGLDPLDMRARNLARRGEVVREGERPLAVDLPGDLAVLAAQAPYRRGISGLALGAAGAGASPVSVAMVRLHPDGSATVLAASTELGQGAQTVLAEIAGRELGISAARIRVISSDTDADTFDRSTGASRSTTVMGRAVQEACRRVRAQAEAVEQVQEVVGVGYSGPHPGDGIGSGARPVLWEIGMGMAEAAVDTETGQVRVDRYVSLGDVGYAIRPDLCEAQEQGSVLQALGHTLYESLEWRDGMLVNGNLIDYRVPDWDSLPSEWSEVLVENGDGPGPYGATGMGEGGVMPVAAAIAGSLRQRYGISFTALPLTPERVWRALAEHARDGPDGGGEKRVGTEG